MISMNLFKSSSAVSKELEEELRAVLSALDPAHAQPILDRMKIDAHAVPSLVFTGQYSSGKSTLIKALTNGAAGVVIGSGVTTDTVEAFDWDGDLNLVDTPGVHAGRPQHDALAEEALRSADLVLFAVTVELFDDILSAHLRDVLGRLGKSHQTMIVVTKSGTMTAVDGVRADAIRDALGPFGAVPWVECDAQYFLDGLELEASDASSSAAFIEASGLARVTELIDRFAREQGELGRLSQPLQSIIALTLEASGTLSDDPNETAVLTVLARQRAALTKKRIHLGSLLDAGETRFRADALRAATAFADRIEADEENDPRANESALDAHILTLNADLGVAIERFETAISQVIGAQFDDLASEVKEIEASPFGRTTVRLTAPDDPQLARHSVEVQPGHLSPDARPPWAGDVGKYFSQFSKLWGAGGGIKASSGTAGHQVVLKLGHVFRAKFKPWGAVKVANTIGKVAKVGGVVIEIGLQAYGVVAEERAAVKKEQARAERRRQIATEVLAQADEISGSARREIDASLAAAFGPELDRLDAMAGVVHEARTSRSQLLDDLDRIRTRAEQALSDLANPRAIERPVGQFPIE